jgi:hypothetical protein
MGASKKLPRSTNPLALELEIQIKKKERKFAPFLSVADKTS